MSQKHDDNSSDQYKYNTNVQNKTMTRQCRKLNINKHDVKK